ncbi:MAG: hypothetical protein Q8877_02925 [Sweet potato little leaf phytoplasma]|nr:hypothetical protein [Sweet potato little leaf phytoplasma]
MLLDSISRLEIELEVCFGLRVKEFLRREKKERKTGIQKQGFSEFQNLVEMEE